MIDRDRAAARKDLFKLASFLSGMGFLLLLVSGESATIEMVAVALLAGGASVFVGVLVS